MAIKFLHDLDLTGQELKNVKLHVTSSAPTAALGAMYYDSGANVLKYYSNAGWQTISNDTDDAKKSTPMLHALIRVIMT